MRHQSERAAIDAGARRPGLSSWGLPAVLAALAVLTHFSGAAGGDWLRYERERVLAGELWRLFSGHFPHLGHAHLALNLCGLALVWWLVGRHARNGEWLWCTGFTLLAVCLGLLLISTDVLWYVGLSGLLHGLLVAGALLGGRRELWLLALVVFKLGWEQWAGPADMAWLGGETIIDAHLYGALGGAVAAALLMVLRSKSGLRGAG